jgi:3-phenylpropionate/trans-cinnamate dioxygenase ferredoxin reductase subunit
MAIDASLPLTPRVRRRCGLRKKAAWVVAYGCGVVLPLVLAARTPAAPGRGIADELGSALGIIALALLGLQLVVPARLRAVTGVLGADVAVRLHRRLADVTFAAIGAHVAVVMLAQPARLLFLLFFGAPWRAQAAVTSTVALALLVGSSVWRGRLQIPYILWRALHIALGAGALILAAVHTVGVHGYLMHGLAAVWLALFVAGSVTALIELRILKPRRLARDAYVIQAVVPEAGGATTIRLQAKGHQGRSFRPGQFAWLKLADNSTGLAEHPFSYSSSALTPARPSFTIKAYKGFSRKVAELEPGTELVLDGPHGSYWPARDAAGYVLIAGGIGITPSLSLLRTAADLGDTRPYLLVYANRSESDIVFAEELEGISVRLNLKVVHVLSAPPADWDGERGRIGKELLDRHLPADLRGFEFFVCASPPAVEATVSALTLAGIAQEFIHMECFENV